jgi:Uma2 family endonuclease
MLINDAALEEELIADRRARGIDGFDEVWNGVYVMAPPADDEHQEIQAGLVGVFVAAISFPGRGKVRAGSNISNQPSDWTQNYRIPDVLVFLNETAAENRQTHWLGGPDFAVEIISPGDRSREKLPFYASVGVKELLLIDRAPWRLELCQLSEGRLATVAVGSQEDGTVIRSQVLDLSFNLVTAAGRPGIRIDSPDGTSWTI